MESTDVTKCIPKVVPDSSLLLVVDREYEVAIVSCLPPIVVMVVKFNAINLKILDHFRLEIHWTVDRVLKRCLFELNGRLL